jgi:hypothetical protein
MEQDDGSRSPSSIEPEMKIASSYTLCPGAGNSITTWGAEDTAFDLTFFPAINRAQYFETPRGKLVEFSSATANITQPAPMDATPKSRGRTRVPWQNESDPSNKCWN